MATVARPDFVFGLAAEFDIDLSSPTASFPPGAFAGFCARYREQSALRDAGVQAALRVNTPFRTYAVHSSSAYQMAYDVAWYFDQVVVIDPIYQWTEPPPDGQIEAWKSNMIRGMQALVPLRAALAAGYVLMAGPSVLPTRGEFEDTEGVRRVLADPETVRALWDAVTFRAGSDRDSRGREVLCFNVALDSGGFAGVTAAPGGDVTIDSSGVGLPIHTGDTIPVVDRARFAALAGAQTEASASELFPREAWRALGGGDRAMALGASALTDRAHVARILNAGRSTPVSGWDPRSLGVSIALPFLRGIEPQHVIDLRERLPAAFVDFRGRLVELVTEAQRDGSPMSQIAVEQRVRERLGPQLRALDAEMRATTVRASTAATAAGLVVAAGAMLASTYTESQTGPLTAGISLISGAVVTGANAVAGAVADRIKASSNNLFFLWKAGR